MITLSQINQYAAINNISDGTDIFTILSQMQLECKVTSKKVIAPILVDPHIEWTVDEVLTLFNS